MRSSLPSPTSSLLVLAIASVAQAHFSPWTRSMYGVSGSRQGNDWQYGAGDPVAPLGPGLGSQDSWWFRGPAFRALAPPAGAVTQLPAGGSITLELACHVAWTSFGWSTTPVGSYLDACPGNPGPYHADPLAQQVIPAQIAGCALGIAQVDNIEDTNMDNIVIFSVQPNCVQTKMTSFDIPAMMPACPGGKCICGWFWLPENGQANFFMTAFDCNVTNVSPLATGFAPLTNAVYCPAGDASCGGKTAQRPLYAYNTPTNIVYPAWPYVFNYARPGYHASWGFQNGAQNNIFLPPAAPSVPAVISATSVPSIPAVPATVSAKVVVSVPAVISTTAIPTVNAIVPSVTSVLATTAPVVLATSATTPVPNPKAIASSRAAAAASSSAAAAAAPACTIASKNGSRSRRSIILDQQAANEDLLDQVFEAQEWSSNQIDILSAWIAKKEALRESQ